LRLWRRAGKEVRGKVNIKRKDKEGGDKKERKRKRKQK